MPGHQFRNYQLVDVLYVTALFIDELIKEIVAELYATKRSRVGWDETGGGFRIEGIQFGFFLYFGCFHLLLGWYLLTWAVNQKQRLILTHIEHKVQIVPGDRVHYIPRLRVLFYEMLVIEANLAVGSLEFFDICSEKSFVGIIFEELFPEGGNALNWAEDVADVLVVVELEIHVFIGAVVEGFWDLGTVLDCQVEIVVETSCTAGVPELL